jgi:hypothetical protein
LRGGVGTIGEAGGVEEKVRGIVRELRWHNGRERRAQAAAIYIAY